MLNLIILTVLPFMRVCYGYANENGFCDAHKQNCDITNNPALKWKKINAVINRTLTNYEECSSDSCACFLSVINEDLQPFEKGITKQDIFESKSRGIHYQVIKHELYRENECMFPFRYLSYYFNLFIINFHAI
ncbi:protein O-glucosyltransferase 1-like [Stegodyphus dumicola]|uniref:protein O-glucosyltransferase 1-like n=1 Tax=Stegodyphus dumicola TaxID=202533 RepID=UPI0015AAE457|nr:protein O-glucosyltransferase 1-like [Stegodyphus dumicola]